MSVNYKKIVSVFAFFIPYKLRPKIYFWLFFNAFLIFFNLFSYSLLIPFFSSLVTLEVLDKIIFLKNIKIYFEMSDIQLINFLGITSIVLILLTNIFLLINERVKFDLIKNLSVNISNIYLQNFIKTDFNFFNNFQRTNVFTRLLLELETLVTNIFYNIFDLFSRILIITFIFFGLFLFSPEVTIFSVTLLILTIFITFFYLKKKITFYGKNIVAQNETRTKILSIISENFLLFKVYNLSSEYISNFLNHTNLYFTLLTNSEVIKKFPRVVLEFIFFIIIIISVIFYINYFIKFESVATLNSELILLLGTFSIATYKLMPSVQQIIYLFSDIRTNYPKLSKIYSEIINLNNNRKKKIKLKIISAHNFNSIILKNVTFKYKTKYIIKNLSLTISPTKKYCIFGKSGSGKTTLIYLILGFLKPTSGTITYKNEHIYNLENIKKLISFAPDPAKILEDKNVLNNIHLGSKQDILNILKITKLLKIHKLYHRKTLNKNLSSGELKRISIARALNSNAIFKIIDEPTANLDKSNRDIVINLINRKYPGIIYVTHDLRLRNKADVIVNLS
jgi:ABC-type branched-subunit amino acid transport system ATPase component